MKVLLSIKPEFANKIFDGLKRFEYRRMIFKRPNIKKVVVYASAPVSKVIGEFEIERILFDELAALWNATRDFAGITEEYFFDYFNDKDKGYAIKVKNCLKYETPLCLQTTYGVTPPQSFMYLD